MIYDIIILGSGPAGLTAALYGARANKKTLILGGLEFGGQTAGIAKLENYPGFAGSGLELSEFIKNQATSFGAEYIQTGAKSVNRKNGTSWEVAADNGETYESRTIIIATGAKAKKLEIKGAKEFTGKGVSYCATCDGFFYSGKIVAVYGGGNTALNDALYLANLAEKVYIIYRKSAFTRAEAVLVDRVNETKNIKCVFDTEISEVVGDNNGMTGLLVKSEIKNQESEIAADGLFVAIGHEANTDFLPEDFERDNQGRLLTDPNSARIGHGLFAAGDVRHTGKMQICTATGWGCEAAMDAIAYVNKKAQDS